MNIDGSDGWHVCFTSREYAIGDNGCELDVAIVKLTDVFTEDHENRSIHHLFHRSHEYVHGVVLSYGS